MDHTLGVNEKPIYTAMVPAPRHWENIIQVNIQIPDKRIMAWNKNKDSSI
jgi:hypothetical protein